MFERPSFLIQSPGSYKSARTLRPHLQDHNKCSCSRLHDGRLKLRFVKNFYLKVINWMFESNIWILGWDGIVTKPFGHPKCLERLLVSASCRARGTRNSSKWLLRHKERYVNKFTCHILSRNLISMTLVAPWNERKGVRGRDLSPPSLPPSQSSSAFFLSYAVTRVGDWLWLHRPFPSLCSISAKGRFNVKLIVW